VALVLITEGNSTKRSTGLTAPGRAAAKGAPAAKTISRLVLRPAGSDKSAVGAGAVMRQAGGLVLLLQARGLTPNAGDSYAVWLYNAPGDDRLLGFVSPAVGSDGTFSSGAALPRDAVRFQTLLITRETSARPSKPGPAVLRSKLSLG
jgi:hypothetical protein